MELVLPGSGWLALPGRTPITSQLGRGRVVVGDTVALIGG
jgi:hypothetical protein